MFTFCLVGLIYPKLKRLLLEGMDCLFEIVITEVSFAKIFAASNQHLTNFLIEHFFGNECREFIILGLHDSIDLVESEKSVFEYVNELVDRLNTILFLLSLTGAIKILFG